MAKESTDKFVNRAYVSITESAAGTLTFKELETGVSVFDKAGWIIHRISYYLDNTSLNEFGAASDQLIAGITVSNKVASLDLSDPAVIDLFNLAIRPIGTPANFQWWLQPFTRDFSTLPMGGILIPPRPVYLAVISAGFASPAVLNARFEFTVRSLTPDEYWELVESYRIIS